MFPEYQMTMAHASVPKTTMISPLTNFNSINHTPSKVWEEIIIHS